MEAVEAGKKLAFFKYMLTFYAKLNFLKDSFTTTLYRLDFIGFLPTVGLLHYANLLSYKRVRWGRLAGPFHKLFSTSEYSWTETLVNIVRGLWSNLRQHYLKKPTIVDMHIREEVITASHIGVWVLVTKYFHLKKYLSEKHEIVKFQGSYILKMVEITYF